MNTNEEALFEPQSTITIEKHTAKTFGLMTLGLGITFLVAYLMYASGLSLSLLRTVGASFPFIMLICELFLVFTLTARMFKMSVSTVRIMFLVYAVLTGVTFALLGYIYDVRSIFIAFGMTTLYFGSLAVIGYTTKVNLLRFGPILFVGLICLLILNLVSWFINLSGFETLICSIGLLIFTGYTAYDTQKMKALYLQNEGNNDALNRLYVYSALQLYLDFVNIFLYILRFIGKKN